MLANRVSASQAVDFSAPCAESQSELSRTEPLVLGNKTWRVLLDTKLLHLRKPYCACVQTLKRTGWVRSNVKGPESIADHMYRMGLMSLISGAEGVSSDRQEVLVTRLFTK